MHKILHIWYGTFLHLQRESIIFFLNRKAVICRSTLLLWVIDGYRLIYLTWNAKHFLPRPKVKSFFSVHKGTFWVLFVLLHILGKQGQAFVKMCVCWHQLHSFFPLPVWRVPLMYLFQCSPLWVLITLVGFFVLLWWKVILIGLTCLFISI